MIRLILLLFIKWIQERRISWEKPHPLIYHEISFPPVTAAAPWDFALCCDLRSYFNHSVGKAISCPQHYANIYFGFVLPLCLQWIHWGQMRVSFTNVIEFHSNFLPLFGLFTVNCILKKIKGLDEGMLVVVVGVYGLRAATSHFEIVSLRLPGYSRRKQRGTKIECTCL